VAVAAIVDQAQQGLLAGFRQGWYGCLGRRADGWLSSPMRCCARPDRWARCRSCAWSRGFGVAGAACTARWPRGRGCRGGRGPAGGVPAGGWPLVVAVDQTTWPRCDAECSPARGLSDHPRGTRRVSRSWPAGPTSGSASWAAGHDWWTAPVDARRILPTADPVQATVGQARALVQRLGATRRPRPSRRSRCWCLTPATTRSR
jgi:hypothetical protein